MARITSKEKPRGGWRAFAAILGVAVAAQLGVAAAARADVPRPTVMLTSACHDGVDAYAFDASLAGFPPDQPVDAVLHFSGVDHSYVGVVSTDATGRVAPTRFGSSQPLGMVTATVTTTINGSRQAFTATLEDPCVPSLSLSDAMCGEGNFRAYLFAATAQCAAYVRQLQNHTARPSIELVATCAGGRYGFTGVVLGVPPGTALRAFLSYGGQQLDVGTASDRFGAVGPVGFSTGSPPGPVSATVTGAGTSLTATLQSPCTTGRNFARAGSDVWTAPAARRRSKRHHHRRHHHKARRHAGSRSRPPREREDAIRHAASASPQPGRPHVSSPVWGLT